MSPTISAASKVSTPRNKILMERNDLFSSETLILESKPKTPISLSKSPIIPELKTPNSLSQTPLSSKITDSKEPESDYDPKTNFLSPRPKFLRYNPNRRVEILKRREEELKHQQQEEESEESISSINEEEDTIKGCCSEHESEEVEEEEEEEMEEEEKGFWNLLFEVMKFLVLVGFVGFSTFYVSVMNDPAAPDLTLQSDVCDVREGFENGLYLEKSVVWLNVSSSTSSSTGFIKDVVELEIAAGEIPVGMTQITVESGGVDDTGFIAEVVEEESEVVNNLELNEELELEENVESVGLNDQFGTSGLGEDVLENSTIENGNAEVVSHEVVYTLELNEIVEDEKELKLEEMVEEENVESVGLFDEFGASGLDLDEDVLENNTIETKGGENAEVVSTEEIAQECEASIVTNEGKSDSKVGLGSGVSIVAAVILLASLILHLKRRKQAMNEAAPTATMRPPSVPTLTEVQEATIAETLEKANPKKDEVVDARIEKAAEAYLNSLFYSVGRVSEDLYGSREAPVVQLLSEFTVEESGSTLRRHSVLKSKTIEGREDSKFLVSVSEAKSRGRKGASSILLEDQTSHSEFSNAESPSFGSFTTQEKITMRDGEVNTPVRRSSRIRTKSVRSP